MLIEELMNRYSSRLNENDRYIWKYISEHKKQCEKMGIEELAKCCNVSRTTIMRFAQKLSLEGFSELKVRLKMEKMGQPAKQSRSAMIIAAYEQLFQDVSQYGLEEVAERIYDANRVFIFGSGMVQRLTAQEMRRLFTYSDKNFFDFSGKSEFLALVNRMNSKDLLIILSVSGESEDVLELAKKALVKNVSLISITKKKKNILAGMSDINLYVSTPVIEQSGYKMQESMTSYYIVSEMIYLRYLDYVETRENI